MIVHGARDGASAVAASRPLRRSKPHAYHESYHRRTAGNDGAADAGADAPGTNPATGARQGHEPGVGTSLPLSDKASNITPSDTRSNIAPTLPQPATAHDTTTQDYLRAARTALAGGHTGQAQQSLEMAETRALDRSVAQGQTNAPSDSPLVSRIRDARHALGAGRPQACHPADRSRNVELTPAIGTIHGDYLVAY